MADGDVAAVRITMKRSISAENHFVEGTGESGRDFIARDMVGVEVREVVRTMAAQVLHNQNALFRPDNWVISSAICAGRVFRSYKFYAKGFSLTYRHTFWNN